MTKTRLIGAFALVLMSAAAVATNKKTKPVEQDRIPGQFVVEFRESLSATSVHALGGPIIDQVNERMVVVQRDPKESSVLALRSLRELPQIKAVDPNYIYKVNKVPNDPEFGKLWGLTNDGGLVGTTGVRGLKGVDIGAAKAWDKTTGSKDVIVAIIDTGIDFKIPDLTQNAWTNEKELNGKAGVDDDANGYIDDVHGFNFAANVGDSTDDNGHGSHCAGTIGARGDDGSGIAGVNWNVSLMAVKFLDANGSGSLANAIKAIDYARKNGAKVLSNSWGGGAFVQTLFDSISETQKAGELFVAAAGNDGTDNDAEPAYPASYKIDTIISVAALDSRGALADFSNFGETSVHIAAPGVSIYSTTPDGFEFMSGTSMATPHVSGAAALLLADNPNLTALEIKKRLIAGARPLHSLKGRVVSGGILDISYALSGDTPPADPNDPAIWSEKLAQTVSSPHPYGNKLNQSYTVTVPGASRMSLHFSRFETENSYDTVEFFNKAGESLGSVSGTRNDSYSPIADGDTIVMKATSDDSVNGYGFDVDSVAFEKAAAPAPTPVPTPTPAPSPVPTPAP